MKVMGLFVAKLAGFALVLFCWRLAARHTFPFLWSLALTWGAVALIPAFAAAARRFLDQRPTPERAALLTIPVHYLVMILLGCAVIIAFPSMGEYPIACVPFPRAVSFRIMQLLGVLAILTVLNLAIQGLGLPFAAVISRRLATNWLYAHSRNPMLFSTLLFFAVAAVWMQSLHAILWTLLWLSPAMILYVRIYEERELEVRFGESYLRYKAKTPFFL